MYTKLLERSVNYNHAKGRSVAIYYLHKYSMCTECAGKHLVIKRKKKKKRYNNFK